MATIKTIPSEVMDQIAENLSSADLLNFFVTDHHFNAKLYYNMCQKAAEIARENAGFMSWACYTGKTNLVAMLLQGRVDVNEGLSMLASGMGQFPPWEISGIHEHPDLRNLAGPSETHVRKFCRHASGAHGRVIFNGDTSGLQECYDYIFEGNQPQHKIVVQCDYIRPGQFYRKYVACGCLLVFPLHMAALGGNLDTVKLLVENGASLDGPSRRLYDWLTSSKGDPFESWDKAAHSFEMLTPLYVAARQGHIEIVKLLLESGASKLRLALQPMSLLHVAAEFSGVDMARFAVEQRHCNVNEPDAQGLTPIWLAYLRKDWELVFYLQNAGGNIDHDLHTGFTPLAHALLNQKPGHAKTLIRAGANVNITLLGVPRQMTDIGSPLRVPCFETATKCIGLPAQDICKQLLADAVEKYDLSCAEYAPLSKTAKAEKHVSECADLLAFFSGPIDLSQTDDRITSILLRMFNPDKTEHIKLKISSPAYITKSRARVVDALLQLGGDPAAKNHNGKSLVRLALAYFSFPCITVLARYNGAAIQEFNSFWGGLDRFIAEMLHPRAVAKRGYWSEACQDGFEAFIHMGLIDKQTLASNPNLGRLLVRNFSQRVNPDGLSNFILKELDLPEGLLHALVDGQTLLHHALFSTNAANLNKLLDAGADVNQPDEWGCCPLIVQLVLVEGPYLGPKVPAIMKTIVGLYKARVHLTELPRRTIVGQRKGDTKSSSYESGAWWIDPSADVDEADWAAFNPVMAIIQSMKLPTIKDNSSNSAPADPWISRLSHLLECAAEEPLPLTVHFRYVEEACKRGHAGAVKALLAYKNPDIDQPLQDGRTNSEEQTLAD
ncbi:hypothetical protein B0T19DRAFT_462222 [Cercophora scortea]|uniref:Ankyrin n=1 Tax=Cercophora scortea TaxID=314031 RepID=A0AAE0IP32_9PEZI|nr:hypothetical protein B0T19DRAFT_462222 [Cercophora scortea]